MQKDWGQSFSIFFKTMGVFFHEVKTAGRRGKSPSLQISPDPRALLDVCGSTLVDLCYIFAFLLRVRGWEKDLEGNLRCPKGGDACTITWITNFRVKHAEGALTPVLCFLSYAGLLHGRNWCRIVITRALLVRDYRFNHPTITVTRNSKRSRLNLAQMFLFEMSTHCILYTLTRPGSPQGHIPLPKSQSNFRIISFFQHQPT